VLPRQRWSLDGRRQIGQNLWIGNAKLMSPTTIEIRVGANLPPDQLTELYDSVGWYAYTTGPRGKDLSKAIRNSTYVVSAWTGETLIGIARGLSDDVAIFFLQDVLVRPAFQGNGIGRQLVQNCLARFAHVRSRVLLTDDHPRQLQFYESLGFTNLRQLKKRQVNAFLQTEGVE